MIKRLMLVGRSEAGKTTLTQALMGKDIKYEKTQYISYDDLIIDTPGEYMQTKHLGSGLAVYSYESDVIGLLMSSTEPFSLYPPNITGQATRDVIGIVTKIDRDDANPERAADWLRLCGCKRIFKVSSYTGEGIPELLEYLTKNRKNNKKQHNVT